MKETCVSLCGLGESLGFSGTLYPCPHPLPGLGLLCVWPSLLPVSSHPHLSPAFPLPQKVSPLTSGNTPCPVLQDEFSGACLSADTVSLALVVKWLTGLLQHLLLVAQACYQCCGSLGIAPSVGSVQFSDKWRQSEDFPQYSPPPVELYFTCLHENVRMWICYLSKNCIINFKPLANEFQCLENLNYFPLILFSSSFKLF